jgi:hypothetical protein
MWIWTGRCASLVAVLCIAGSLVRAQQPCLPSNPSSWLCPPPGTLQQGPGTASPCFPAYPAVPVSPYTPGNIVAPESTAPPGTVPQPSATTAPEAEAVTPEAALAGLATGAGVGTSVALVQPGYIDNAVPMTMFRLRFDAAYDDNRPDRAEFFYAKCGCFPGAPGPPLSETSVNYQDISAYLEVALSNRFSAFIEVPVRFIDPELNRVSGGLADMNAGFKWAFVASDQRYLTFQLRTYIPTGNSERGLGTDHVSLEPAFLAYQQCTDRLILFGEFRDWIPIGGTDFAGNIIRYGAGLGYEVYQSPRLRFTPITEFVGWTVLGGKEFLFPEDITKDAAGDTIVNVKIGGRLDFGQRSSFYFGYGRALTGTVWYKDIYRAEYRLVF